MLTNTDKNNMNKEVDLSDNILSLDADKEVIEAVRSGKITHLVIKINEDNQNSVLENADGHLVMTVNGMPDTYYGCYMYNDGVFPYLIKRTLDFLVLNSEEDGLMARIIDVCIEPGMRFNYKGPGYPIEEDPDGDSCVWEVAFEILPIPNDAKTYLMRWNPSISSFTEEDYKECLENMVHGMFRMDWSIAEWEEARMGDFFYMLRTGDDKAGIVFCGQFLCDPYPSDDWAGSTKRRMYVDMICACPVEPDASPYVPLSKLQEVFPTKEWSKGHSGELLSEEIADKLDELYVQ